MGGQIKVSGLQGAVYGSNGLGENNDLNWQADYGRNQNKGTRQVFGGAIASSDYNSSSIHVGARAAHTMAVSDATKFKPSVSVDYTNIKEDGYTEAGAGALDLTVGAHSTSAFVLGVDGKVSHALSDATNLFANLGLDYDTQAKQASITSSFQGGGAAFTTEGINPSKTTLRYGVGVVVSSSKSMQITARYDGASRSGFTGKTASVKFNMPF